MSWEVLFQYEFLRDLVISVSIFLLFLLFRKIFAKYVYTLLLKISKKAPTDFLTQVFQSFEKPVQWFFIVIGIYVAARYFPYFNQRNPLFLTIIKSFIIFLIAWGFFNLSSASSLLLTRANKKYNMEIDEILIPFLSKAIRFVIALIGFSIIAEEFGYNISTFVAGLGIGGLAVSLAAKDALANFFGGIVIITEKPFSIGDWIMTSDVEGTVEDITFRSTKIRTFSDAIVTVPNATLASASITNWSKMEKRQVSFRLKIAYDTPGEKLKRVVNQIEDLLKNHPEINKDSIHVNFNQYGDDGLEVFIYFFTNTTEYGRYLKVKEDINFKILEILEKEEVEIAFPSRRLYIDSHIETMEKGSKLREDQDI